jgi:hypothetical protein
MQAASPPSPAVVCLPHLRPFNLTQQVVKIFLGDLGDGHDVQANIPNMGKILFKSKFLKKVAS